MKSYKDGFPERKVIQDYMTRNVKFHVDQTTLEVNDTALAEDAFSEFTPNSFMDIPDWMFEYAYVIAGLYECRLGSSEYPRSEYTNFVYQRP